MKNYDFQEQQFQTSDPIESYFECITTCDIRDVDVFPGVWKYLNKMKIENLLTF